MIVPCGGRPLERDLVDTRLPTTTVTLARCIAPRISSGMEGFPRGDAYGMQIPGVPSHWFAVFQDRRRPTIGMPTHSQHPRGDRPRRHKGVDMSQSSCILVSSRKHHRSVFRYRPDRGRDQVVGADPSEGWRDAFGNRGGGGWGRARRRGPVRRFSRSRSRGRPDRGLAALPACTRVPRDERHGRGTRLPVADLDALRRPFPFRGHPARVRVTLNAVRAPVQRRLDD